MYSWNGVSACDCQCTRPAQRQGENFAPLFTQLMMLLLKTGCYGQAKTCLHVPSIAPITCTSMSCVQLWMCGCHELVLVHFLPCPSCPTSPSSRRTYLQISSLPFADNSTWLPCSTHINTEAKLSRWSHFFAVGAITNHCFSLACVVI